MAGLARDRTPCRVCGGGRTRQLLDAGRQPISNRYLSSAQDVEDAYAMLLAQCSACGLVQLAETIPASALRPSYSWIAYHEPDQHLQQLVDRIVQLPGVSRESVLCGISVNDDPLLNSLADRGYGNSWRVDLERDLGVSAPAGIETLQHCLGPEQAQSIVARRGRADVVITRYSFEHAHDPVRFMDALRTFTRSSGFIVIEVPDSVRPFEAGDAGAIWEEHVLYFTPASLHASLAALGFDVVDFAIYPHELEDSLVCTVAVGESAATGTCSPNLAIEVRRAEQFVQRMLGERDTWLALLAEYTHTNRKVAVFGAGHRSCTLINLLGLAEHLEFVVDDDPNKAGLFMPGSRLPIVPSSRLQTDDISLCLLSLSPQGQRKVVERNRAFVARGGTFLPLGMHTINSSRVAEHEYA